MMVKKLVEILFLEKVKQSPDELAEMEEPEKVDLLESIVENLAVERQNLAAELALENLAALEIQIAEIVAALVESPAALVAALEPEILADLGIQAELESQADLESFVVSAFVV